MKKYEFIYEEIATQGYFYINPSFGAFFITLEPVKDILPKDLNLTISEKMVVASQGIKCDYQTYSIRENHGYIFVIAKKDSEITENLEDVTVDSKTENQIIDYFSQIFRLPNGNYVVSSLQNYISAIEEIEEKYPGKETFFRGHYSNKYLLVPSLYRKKAYYDNESRMYMDFKTQFYNELANKKYIEILTTMQHYSMPTRLLDTTSNPLVALYMACSRPIGFTGESIVGEVVIMNEYSKNVKYSDSNAITLLSCLSVLETNYKQELYEKIVESLAKNDPSLYKTSIAYRRFVAEAHNELPYFDESFFTPEVLLYPRHVRVGMINERIIAQSGSFIIFGLCNYETGEYKNLNTVSKEKVYITNRDKILKQLEMMNVNDGTMYPDKDHRSHSIMKSYLMDKDFS